MPTVQDLETTIAALQQTVQAITTELTQLTTQVIAIASVIAPATGVPIPSASGTTVPPADLITDTTGTLWTLVSTTTSGAQISRSGTVDSSTSNVTIILFLSNIVYYQTGVAWYSWTNNAWVSVPDPRPTLPVASDITVAAQSGQASVIIPSVLGAFVSTTLLTVPVNGTVGLSGINIVYTPRAGFTGKDVFTYRVANALGQQSNTSTVTVNVTALVVLTTSNITTSVLSGASLTIPPAVVGTFTSVQFTNPSHGSVTLSGTNLLYTPVNGYTGLDSFTYFVTNALGLQSNTSTVSINVGASVAPVASSTNFTATKGIANTITPTVNKVYASAQVKTQPAHGTVAVSGLSFIYTPTAGYTGADSFTYAVTDQFNQQSNTATIAITVVVIGARPWANGVYPPDWTQATNTINATSLGITQNWDVTINTSTADSAALNLTRNSAGFVAAIQSINLVDQASDLTLAASGSSVMTTRYSAIADALNANKASIFVLRIGYEPNTSTVGPLAWQPGTAGAATYCAAFRTFAGILRTKCPWLAIDWTYLPTGSDPSLFYPGDYYVDIVGGDYYSQIVGGWTSALNGAFGLTWQSTFATSTASKNATNAAVGPAGEAATGGSKFMSIPQFCANNVVADDSAFITNMFSWVTGKGTSIAYVGYYNQEGVQGSAQLDQHPTCKAAYLTAINNTTYSGFIPYRTLPTPTANNESVTAKTAVATLVPPSSTSSWSQIIVISQPAHGTVTIASTAPPPPPPPPPPVTPPPPPPPPVAPPPPPPPPPVVNTNLVPVCSTFNGTGWNDFSTTISGTTVADPTGVGQAQVVIFGTTQCSVSYTLPTALLPNTTYTASIYAQLQSGTGVIYFAWYDGTDHFSPGFNTSTTWQAIGSWTFTTGATAATNFAIANLQFAGSTGASNIALWGLKIEPGSARTTFVGCQGSAPPPPPPPVAPPPPPPPPPPPASNNNLVGVCSTFNGPGWSQFNATIASATVVDIFGNSTPPPPPPPPTSTGKVLAAWVQPFGTPNPTLAQIVAAAPKYTCFIGVSLIPSGPQAFTFDTVIPPGDSASTIATWKALGKGAYLQMFDSSPFSLLSQADADALFPVLTGYIDQYGFNGFSWDMESGGTTFLPQFIINISSRLKTKYGAGFVINMAPRHYDLVSSGLITALLDSSMDYALFQEYDNAVYSDPAFAQMIFDMNDTIVNLGVPASKVCIGFANRDATGDVSAALAAQIITFMQTTYPGFRGAGIWTVEGDAQFSWAYHNALAPVLGL